MNKKNKVNDQFVSEILKDAQPELETFDFNGKVMNEIRQLEQLKDRKRSWIFSGLALFFAICLVWYVSSFPGLNLFLSKLNIPLLGDSFTMVISIGIACFILFQLNLLLSKVVRN